MPTPFVADAADEAVRSESILNERKAADIIEETALEVDIRAWRAEGLRLLQAASAREDHVPRQSIELLVAFARTRVLPSRRSAALRATGVVSSSLTIANAVQCQRVIFSPSAIYFRVETRTKLYSTMLTTTTSAVHYSDPAPFRARQARHRRRPVAGCY